ncbi:hypothetical protein M409DRAFT_20810 [Zasmidium cellare ATCC 36951]|uniref:Zn(2)-C6 fungal-type domain-containing protein n=1 Tax=Zasmidium cellare ATCC 36951 TaxID=1080233 RepID=A0A6A6CNU0_ZASCE|nr:uncharacterized protein M409DRAFT_20810 [Zasmidium cellare ATCC 36951]KAF2168794.1 hypothetical protein M409DRAFT_20810 [Zasmidium cellare ATCC 36951]
MPTQRGTRGSYAKYICNHCRKRKIKCDLPSDVDISPLRQAQPAATSCQRCITKGLDCVVDFTILGRPSSPREWKMTRNRSSSKALSRVSPSGPSQTIVDIPDDGAQSVVDDYLMVQPQKTADSDQPTSTPQRRTPQAADKVQAMSSPSYLLSTLLRRDHQFASLLDLSLIKDGDINQAIDTGLVPEADKRLVWHRLFYPDIPVIATLHAQVLSLSPECSEYLPTAFLYALLLLLAEEVDANADMPLDRLRGPPPLASLVAHLARRTILALPTHRYAILALDLLAKYKPLMLASDRISAPDAVRTRLVPPLLKEMALDLGIDSSPSKLQPQLQCGSAPLDPALLDDCLTWYRLCLRDDILAGNDRRGMQRQMTGETLADVVDLLQILLRSDDLPPEYIFSYHSMLCQASKLEHLLRVKDDWRNLDNLSRAIDDHKKACEWQRQTLRASIPSLPPGQALVMTQLLDMQLHSAYCWVSGSATFYAVMAGARFEQSPPQIDVGQALEVSDQIIERFADSSRQRYASEPHTEFLIKYGSSRMEDLELALLNFVSAMDNLSLQGIPYVPPTRHTTSHILFMVKDVMEGQAARMKGWGGLHERTHMHLLLIRDCANSLERVGSWLTGVSGPEAIAKGCLWAATARLLRSLHRLLSEWKEWNALGQIKVSAPPQTGDRNRGMDLELDFLPDDLFFDWDLWLSEENIPM